MKTKSMDDLKKEDICIKKILFDIAEALKKDKIKDNPIYSKTKIVKLICIIADKLNIPLTRSWYLYGEYIYMKDIPFDLFGLLTQFHNNIDIFRNNIIEDINKLDFELRKKLNQTSNLIHEYIFGRKYFYDKKFLLNFYILNAPTKYKELYLNVYLFRNLLNNFLNEVTKTEFDSLKKYSDYMISDEFDFDEKFITKKDFVQEFSNIISKIDLESNKINLNDEILEQFSEFLFIFESLLIKLNKNHLEDLKINKNSIDIFNEFCGNFNNYFFSTIANKVSIETVKGFRAEEAKGFYENNLNKIISLIPKKLKEVKEKLRNSKLELTHEEALRDLKSEDKKLRKIYDKILTHV